MMNLLFVFGGTTNLKCSHITAWSGEMVEHVLQKATANQAAAMKFYQKWPVLRVFWVAYKIGSYEEGPSFSSLPWPLMVQILRWVGEVNHIPALYTTNKRT